MAFSAPWLQSPNVLQIAQAGSQTGLGLRHQQLAEAEEARQAQDAANLLNYHYTQLQASQQKQQAQLAQTAQATAAARALAQAKEQALEVHRQAQEKQATENASALKENRDLNRDIRAQNYESQKSLRDAQVDAKRQQQQMREHSIGFWSDWNGIDNPALTLKKYPWASDEPGVKTALTQWSIDQRASARQRSGRENILRREQAALQKRDPETLSEDEKTRMDEIGNQLRTFGQQGIPVRDKKTGRTGRWYDNGKPMPDDVELIQSAPAGEGE